MKAVASQNVEAFASLRAIADHSFDSVAAVKVFEGRAVNYDSKKRPFTMHWRVVPIRGAVGQTVDYFVAIQRNTGVT